MKYNLTFGPEPRFPLVESAKNWHPKDICIAGPCSIESFKQISTIADFLKAQGVEYMRGGVYRAGTYPPKDFGLQQELLQEWKFQADIRGLKTVVEVIDLRILDILDGFADVFQVGTRQMQNYGLLDCLGNQSKPVVLKRNTGATMYEFLGAAEYLLQRGNKNVILCERGSSTFNNHVRWDLSISMIPAIKLITDLPVIVDASHGTGRKDLVESMTLAGIAAGADGFLVEIHTTPEKSLSDAAQALPLEALISISDKAKKIKEIVNGKRN